MLKKIYSTFKNYEGTGFGTNVSQQGRRFIRKNGKFNVVRSGLGWWRRFKLYHWLLTMPWWRFQVFLILIFISFNVFFASLYMLIGTDHLLGVMAENETEKFVEVFFFSVQTFTTVGYGRINPIDLPANIIAGTEAFTGLLTAAIATGLLFAKFSMPQADLLFSKTAIVCPHPEKKNQLMFRFANLLDNQLTDINIQVILALAETQTQNGEWHFYNLHLERNHLNFLPLSWTVVHTIDETSPLYGLTVDEFNQTNAELLILITVFNDTFAQEVHVRHSYKYDEIIWNARFVPMFKPSENSSATELQLDKIDEYQVLV